MEKNSLPEKSIELTPIWNFVHPDEYILPKTELQKATLDLLIKLKKIFVSDNQNETSYKLETELDTLSEDRLSYFVPPIPWHDVAQALESKLHSWLNEAPYQKTKGRIKFIICQPFLENEAILSLIKNKYKAYLVHPPSAEKIINEDQSWFDNAFPSNNQLWILPNLERCFLRHANGLNLVRQLLTKVTNNELGTGIITCDSWAWSYLKRIHAWHLSDELTLQAFDASHLNALITQFMQHSKMHVTYCNATNGHQILPNNEHSEPIKELNELTAHSRGNIVVALKYWQQRLYDERTEAKNEGVTVITESSEKGELSNDTNSPVIHGKGKTLWLAKMPEEPTLPAGNREEFLLVLHSLLLHGGLTEKKLAFVLPFSLPKYQGLLAKLEQSNIIECTNNYWYLTTTAYPSVRKLLSTQNFLTDMF